MLLTITSTKAPATDLGYLLHKNPTRLHEFEMPFGKARVFYPYAEESRCTAALLLEVDPVRLVRGGDGPGSGAFDQYVNDRPYVATSFLSSALLECFGTAMSGRSKDRQELADSEIPLVAHLPVIPCRSGAHFLQGLFEPLGYAVEVQALPLDPPDWGDSHHYALTLTATKRLRDLLNHLYVLIPVVDESKHYYVNRDEIDKLLNRGKDWLATHPMRAAITRRYLHRDRALTREALKRLAEMDGEVDPDEKTEDKAEVEEAAERPISLHQLRLQAVVAALLASGARSVLDLGCGEGRLLELLFRESSFERVVGMDVSFRSLERAKRRFRTDRMPERQAARLALLHGSLVYRDQRLEGFDAAAVVEVIEHLDPHRLAAFQRVLFAYARPRTVVLTTPNREYNALFPTLPPDRFRHDDHRFEWTRSEFQTWATQVAEQHGYQVEITGIGPEDLDHGAPSQMAVFRLAS